MAKIGKLTLFIGISFLSSVIFSGIPTYSAECTQRDSSGHCLRVSQNKESTVPSRDGSENLGNNNGDLNDQSYKLHTATSDISQDLSSEFQNWINWFNNNYQSITDESGAKIYARKTANRRPGEAACHTEDMKPGEYAHVKEKPIESTTNGDTIYCKTHDAKTLTPSNPTPPKGPTIEEMLQEIEDQFANTVLQPRHRFGRGQPQRLQEPSHQLLRRRTHRTLGRRPHDRPRRNRILPHPNDHPIRQRRRGYFLHHGQANQQGTR